MRRLIPVAAAFLLSPWLCGFTVVKDVSAGKPPVEKLVIFEKGKPVDYLQFKDAPNCKMGLTADGAIEVIYTGNEDANPTIYWKPGGKIPVTFDATAYDLMIMTCRVEGSNKETDPRGKVSDKRPDNLWFGPRLVDATDQPVGGCNLADVADDGKTPVQTVTLKIPMALFKLWSAGRDLHHIKGICFPWGKTRPTVNRNFRLVIDRIALAD